MGQYSKHISFWLCLISALSLVFIGIRFFTNPHTAEVDYGLQIPASQDFSFDYIKGVRDIFFGALIILLLLNQEWKALSYCLFAGAIVPMGDFFVVLSQKNFSLNHLYAHIFAILVCIGCGIYYKTHIKFLTKDAV